MKVVRIIPALCLVMFLSSCSLKPGWDVVGKWQKVGGAETIEFAVNGSTLTLVGGPLNITATYQFTDQKHMEIQMGGLGSIVVGFEVAGDELTLTNQKGQAVKYKKVKPELKKVEAKPEVKPGAKPEAKPEAKKPEAKPEAKHAK